MQQITIDAATLAQLESLRETVQLIDASGRVLGLFDPVPRGPYDLSEVPQLSAEEIARRLANPRRRTWAEIRRDLEAAS